MVKLEKLYLIRGYHGDVTGQVEFSGENGKLEISLNDDACRKILAAVGDALVQTLKDIAKNLTTELIEGVKIAKLDSK